MTVLLMPLLRAAPSGAWMGPQALADAAAACLRTALGLPQGSGSWSPTPAQTAWTGHGAEDFTLELAPGARVRWALGAETAWDPGQYHQEYRVSLHGFRGARFEARGDTLDAWAVGHLGADSPAAALALWHALRGVLGPSGWADLSAADAEASAQLRALSEEAGIPLAWDALQSDTVRAWVHYARRGLDRQGRLHLSELAPGPLSGEALGALLAALPAGGLRDLVLPRPRQPAPLGAGTALASLERLEGAFERTPPPGELPALAEAYWSGRLPGDLHAYPWDELARLERLTLSTWDEPTTLPGAVLLSPSLRELTLYLGFGLALPATAAVGPLRLLKLRVELGGRALSLPGGALPSAHSLEALSLCRASLPEGLGAPLPRLRSLMLQENGLRALPGALAGCAALEEVRVVDNPLASLRGLPALPRLRAVSLARTALAAWPAELEALPALEELDLSGLQLELSRDEVQARLPRLKVLHYEPR